MIHGSTHRACTLWFSLLRLTIKCTSIIYTYFFLGETVGGNSRNASCVFPFIYKDMAYTTCIDLDHTKPWCATTDNYDSDRRWGECVGEYTSITNGVVV